MGFIAGEVAAEIGKRVKPLYEAIKKCDADLADQVYRAAKSLVLNASEGGDGIATTTFGSRPSRSMLSSTARSPSCGASSTRGPNEHAAPAHCERLMPRYRYR